MIAVYIDKNKAMIGVSVDKDFDGKSEKGLQFVKESLAKNPSITFDTDGVLFTGMYSTDIDDSFIGEVFEITYTH